MTARAQEASPAMADTLRSEGKIYVVVAVIAAIFACIVIFLVALERRLSRIEDRLNKEGDKTT